MGASEGVNRIKSVLHEALQMTSQAKEREMMQRLQEHVNSVNNLVANTKKDITKLTQQTEKMKKYRPDAAEVRIRCNLEQAMAVKHQQVLVDFQSVQREFKETLQRRQTRELQFLLPEKSEQELLDMIESGETLTTMVTKKVAGTHALVLEEVDRIREKNNDIKKLEANVADLAQMFVEVQTLVSRQGEMLDSIEVHVTNAKSHVEKAEVHLERAGRKQRAVRKGMCCMATILCILMTVIIAPIMGTALP